MPFELPPLPYPSDSLEPHIDKATMEVHHGGHHKAYVDNLNKAIAGTHLESKSLDEIVTGIASVPENIRGPVRNNGGGHWNHSFFWKLLSGKGGGAPSGKLGDAINSAFGSFDTFKEKFEAAGVGR
ncbi:MAG TPA: superoxide dismutase, partial [Candidatus Acidoferrum sp.]|nr:superoxide dismutase [Candidatus Acidoferrum sp.]